MSAWARRKVYPKGKLQNRILQAHIKTGGDIRFSKRDGGKRTNTVLARPQHGRANKKTTGKKSVRKLLSQGGRQLRSSTPKRSP